MIQLLSKYQILSITMKMGLVDLKQLEPSLKRIKIRFILLIEYQLQLLKNGMIGRLN